MLKPAFPATWSILRAATLALSIRRHIITISIFVFKLKAAYFAYSNKYYEFFVVVRKIHTHMKAVPWSVDPKSTLHSLIFHFPPRCRLQCPHCRRVGPLQTAGHSPSFIIPLLHRLLRFPPTFSLSFPFHDTMDTAAQTLLLCPHPLSLPTALHCPMGAHLG